MKRPASAEKVLERLRRWREICPDITVRSTFIVGFPGETDADFSELLSFLEEAQLDRVGCFEYSPVEGAAANDLPDAVPDEIKAFRKEKFMQLQAKISAGKLKARIGKKLKVLIDAPGVGRSSADAPEIDGVVRFKAGKGKRGEPGEFAEVLIDRADAHDLFGRLQ
jgi:ribosomal protein S12 methylthiotransferase